MQSRRWSVRRGRDAAVVLCLVGRTCSREVLRRRSRTRESRSRETGKRCTSGVRLGSRSTEDGKVDNSSTRRGVWEPRKGALWEVMRAAVGGWEDRGCWDADSGRLWPGLWGKGRMNPGYGAAEASPAPWQASPQSVEACDISPGQIIFGLSPSSKQQRRSYREDGSPAARGPLILDLGQTWSPGTLRFRLSQKSTARDWHGDHPSRSPHGCIDQFSLAPLKKIWNVRTLGGRAHHATGLDSAGKREKVYVQKGVRGGAIGAFGKSPS